MSQPFDRYPGQHPYGWAPPSPSWPPGAWSPYPGAPAPAPQRRRRALVAWTVGGALLAVAIVAVIAVGGYRMGSTQMAGALAGPPTAPAADWTVVGNDAGLDAYAERCHDGEMDACDDLYEVAELQDAGADYVYYGLTCGGRVHPRDVPTCTLLD